MQNKTNAYFTELMVNKRPTIKENKELWAYTRVSSKEQETNYSLQNQKSAIKVYADKHSYVITQSFGHTYESAKNDFTREEFQRLLTAIKKSKKRPYAIAVFVMSRFSRNVKSISLVDDLVSTHGVHIIEVSTGLSTETEDDKLAIYDKLLIARRENVNRLKLTIPGMRSFMLEGNWLGNVPKGYDHHGPRVKGQKYSEEQKIILNEDGKVLKEAWQWKLAGKRDIEILEVLKVKGVNMSKQKLFSMWRNPFYCGINVNKMLDSPVKGKWEKMVSEEEFITLQHILSGIHRGAFKQSPENDLRPLRGTVLCPICDSKLVGYQTTKTLKNRTQELHYYKCNSHAGISYNAETTVRAKFKGLNQVFADILKLFQIDDDDLQLLGLQLKKLIMSQTEINAENQDTLKNQLGEIKLKMKSIKVRFACGDISLDVYEVANTELSRKETEIASKLSSSSSHLSNQNLKVEKALSIARNISQCWERASLEAKQSIQNLIFPEGLVIDRETGAYLTKKINQLFYAIAGFSMSYDQNKKGPKLIKMLQSPIVAGTGLEPVTFGL